MKFEKNPMTQEVLILKRADFEAIPITLHSSVFTTDATVIKAGTPLASDGKIATTTEATQTDPATTTVVGILLHDVEKTNPNGALLKKAYLDKEKVKDSYGSYIDATMMAALPMIVFE